MPHEACCPRTTLWLVSFLIEFHDAVICSVLLGFLPSLAELHALKVFGPAEWHSVCVSSPVPSLLNGQANETLCRKHTVKLAYLVEVAALASAHSRLLIEQSEEIPNVLLGDYYIHSRNRFNRWMRDLNDIEHGVAIRDPLHLFGLSPRQPPAQSLAEQILVNDLLNRVWTVMLIACDRHRGEARIESLAHNVFRSHLTVRHRAMSVCVNDSSLAPEQVHHIEKLKTSSERWADLLNCALMDCYDLWEYACDETRAREFFRDRFHKERIAPQNSQAWSLILAGLRHSFPDIDGLSAPVHDDDRMITRCIIDSFPGDTQSLAIWSLPTVQKSQRV